MTPTTAPPMHQDPESCYRAVKSRDRRFDGVFYTAVRTTGIYCRPSCPARTPAFHNVTFHPTAAAAQSAGYRACKRCLPDATPGSPDWDVAADVAGRAMRLIGDGVVDREGVDGLAHRIGYTTRHLSRILTQELGAGPLALARAKRAQTARVLLETSDLGAADVAFAAGFSSVRQFNDTVREVYASTPTQLRGGRRGGAGGTLQLRLAVRTPFAGRALLAFLATRAVSGVEVATDTTYSRTLRLPHGTGTVELELADVPESGATAFVPATFWLSDLRDLAAAVERVRRLVDADCDPVAISDAFAGDPVLGPRVRRLPGLRVPGHVDGDELAVRAVLGQQVTVAAARTAAGRLTEQYGEPLPIVEGDAEERSDGLTQVFPTVETLSGLDPESLPMPRARGRALVALCRALADGDLSLDRAADRDDVRRRLLEIPGIGPWTADYIALRALGHPDVFLPTDIGIRDALRLLGRDPADAAELAEGWRPWRSYAQLHLWQTLTSAPTKGH
jgi:AraC family transcriptional regulator of adaptative response / DNA-3-methyladenine glycosylase II